MTTIQQDSPTRRSDAGQDSIVSLRNLKTHFELDEGVVRAVDGVNLEIPRGKTLCVVGESGCGKSQTAFSILRLISPPGRIVDGQIILHEPEGDTDITSLPEDGSAIRRIRGNKIAMIFQEPMSAFSPVHTVGNQIMEGVRLHTDKDKQAAREHAIRVMQQVGIPDSRRRVDQYPHEMSGGLRQRAMIAMALSCSPSLLIADEPTTALDVTIQAQILALMRQLQADMGMSIMLITHDLGVVAQMADEVAVMYLGRVVEQAPVEKIFEDPQHPYTKALLQSVPSMDKVRTEQLKTIQGTVPDPFADVPGCPFHPRCEEAVAGKCDVGGRPPLLQVKPEHQSACLLRHEGKLNHE